MNSNREKAMRMIGLKMQWHLIIIVISYFLVFVAERVGRSFVLISFTYFFRVKFDCVQSEGSRGRE